NIIPSANLNLTNETLSLRMTLLKIVTKQINGPNTLNTGESESPPLIIALNKYAFDAKANPTIGLSHDRLSTAMM
ncbi:TPA: hypothetical protein L7O81_005456, partial [Klebsiella pneumoniae]|nr:hypothetical protein [Klebsiella pneumoniae]